QRAVIVEVNAAAVVSDVVGEIAASHADVGRYGGIYRAAANAAVVAGQSGVVEIQRAATLIRDAAAHNPRGAGGHAIPDRQLTKVIDTATNAGAKASRDG